MGTTKAMQATREVRAFACGMCSTVHATASDADTCCQCRGCGGKFSKRTSYTSECDGCSWGTELREARSRVRRAKEQLEGAESNLARLLGMKPKKAATPTPKPEAGAA